MRRFLIALAVSLTVLTGCSSGTTTLTPRESPSGSASESEPMTTTSEIQDESDTDISSTGEDMSSSESSPVAIELGDRDDPAPVGTLVEVNGDKGQVQWEVTLVSTNLNANEEIREENEFNSSPEAGYQFASATFLVKYMGTDTGLAGSDLSVAFVTSEGTTHKEGDAFIMGPNSLNSLNELYAGGAQEGSVYIAIPTASAVEGTWRLSHTFSSDDFFFQAQ
jgi:hypothetical protein